MKIAGLHGPLAVSATRRAEFPVRVTLGTVTVLLTATEARELAVGVVDALDVVGRRSSR